MTPEHQNIIRSQERKCIVECKAAIAANPGNRDSVTRPIILRHYDQIKTICQPFSLFLVTIGQINGILKERSS